MEILKNFGFEPVLFAAQIVNFLILAFIFKKFMYKPVLKILKERQMKIKKGIEEAELAHASLISAEEKRDEILKKTTIEAEKIIENAKTLAEDVKNTVLEKSKVDAEKIISEGKKQVILEMEKAETQAKEIALVLSEKILEKVIEDLFTKGEKEKILQRNIKILEKHE